MELIYLDNAATTRTDERERMARTLMYQLLALPI